MQTPADTAQLPELRTHVGRRLEIVARLMEYEAATGRGLGVVGVGEHVGREKTQISRALRTLSDAGLAHRDPESMEFVVGTAFLQLAGRAGDPPLLVAAGPPLRQLANGTQARTHITVRRGNQVLTVSTVAATTAVQAADTVGGLTPLHCTASGRVLLSGLAPDAVRELVGPDPLPNAGPGAPLELEDLLERINDAQDAGYAVAVAEIQPDLAAVAAPVKSTAGLPTAAINLSWPTYGSHLDLEAVGRSLRETATVIEERLRALKAATPDP